jgi:hypothetical protein
MAAPGKYSVTLNGSDPRTFEVIVDPGVLLDGVTAHDLVEQQNFLLAVRDTIARATELRSRVQGAMQKAGVAAPRPPGPGEWAAGLQYDHPLQRIWARLATAPGVYPQGMLIDQLSNIVRAEGGADQRVGSESRKRYDDLVMELKALESEVRKHGG